MFIIAVSRNAIFNYPRDPIYLAEIAKKLAGSPRNRALACDVDHCRAVLRFPNASTEARCSYRQIDTALVSSIPRSSGLKPSATARKFGFGQSSALGTESDGFTAGVCTAYRGRKKKVSFAL